MTTTPNQDVTSPIDAIPSSIVVLTIYPLGFVVEFPVMAISVLVLSRIVAPIAAAIDVIIKTKITPGNSPMRLTSAPHYLPPKASKSSFMIMAPITTMTTTPSHEVTSPIAAIPSSMVVLTVALALPISVFVLSRMVAPIAALTEIMTNAKTIPGNSLIRDIPK